MTQVMTGFAIIAVVILVGYAVGRLRLLGDGAQSAVTRLVFFVAMPCQLFDIISHAEPHQVFGRAMAIQVASVAIAAVIYLVLAWRLWRPRGAELLVGTMASSYVNAGNLGIPIAAYVLGDGTQVAPIMLFQLVIYTPLAMTLFGVTTGTGRRPQALARRTVRNPILIASLLALIVMLTGLRIPVVIAEPISLMAGIAVPGALLSFGMSLAAQKPFSDRGERGQIGLASAIKLILQPAAAYLLARYAFGLDGHLLFASTVMAGLPTAQNVFNYASRYGRGESLARDTGLVTTIAALGTLSVIAWLIYA